MAGGRPWVVLRTKLVLKEGNSMTCVRPRTLKARQSATLNVRNTGRMVQTILCLAMVLPT